MSMKAIANKYADMIIHDKMSIREVAREEKVSKTTVHRYISLYTTGFIRKIRLRIQLDKNLEEASYKGGAATKKKYKQMQM